MSAWISAASAVWSAVNQAGRAWAKRRPPVKLPARVISVGNLQAGGAGKTPLVLRIAREGVVRGERVAILMRGYGSAWEQAGGVLEPGRESHPGECGDEAALLHERIPDAWIGVGADRLRSWKSLIARAGDAPPTLVILDDGFQQWGIHRDVEILAVTSDRRDQRVFRERLSRSNLADLVVWTKGQARPTLGATQAPWVRVEFRPQIWKGSEGPERPPLLLVTGVGDPVAVSQSLRQAGWTVAEHQRLEDHARFEARQAALLIDRAKREGLSLAMTGKDWVKWRGVAPTISGSAAPWVFEPELEILEGREDWNRVIWGESS